MSPAWIALLTFVSTTLLAGGVMSAVYDTFFRYPAAVRERLQEMAGKKKHATSTSLLNFKQLSESASQAPGHWRAWAREMFEQSGVRVGVRTLAGVGLGLGSALAVVVGLFTRQWWASALSFPLGAILPGLYICLMRRARIVRLTRQLPDALDVMCRAVRAGQTVPASFQMVADDFPPPISDEFRYCYEQQNLGISNDAALRGLARRTGIMELRILVVALLVQTRSGGSLTELLTNLSTVVRKRLVLHQKVRALTGEGRMQAVVLTALPAVVFAAMYIVNREYAQVLLDRPWMLAGCVISQMVGALMIRKLIQIDY